ncbi:MAG TPA: methyltransferase domain-containing protein [Vicinamibacterales bacterium]|nr:methyltransferase domain-containing protein [Vicinamibacterales bacterium]
MRFLRRGGDPRAFALAMIGVKMGDRLLQVGAGDGALLAALASKVGLTGAAVLVEESDEGLAAARHAAEREGVLVEPRRAPFAALPADPGSFDVVVVNGVLRDATPEARVAIVADVTRVVRAGGRCIVVDRATRGGLAGLLGGPAPDPAYQPEELLRRGGFKAVRTLAEREGLRFTEGVRAREQQ